MKKRWLLTGLFALTFCVCAASAQAAVVSGGTEYLWYAQAGEMTWDERHNEVVAFGGQKFYLSADGGASYAPLPEIQMDSAGAWTDYEFALEPLENGGIRIRGRSVFGQAGDPYTYCRDYSPEQLEKALAEALPVPVRVIAANENVAVGLRKIGVADNQPSEKLPAYNYWRQQKTAYQLVWTLDGVNWSRGEWPESIEVEDSDAWWDGEAFFTSNGSLTSADGIHWTETGRQTGSRALHWRADLDPYRFEIKPPQQEGERMEVYLMTGDSADRGVLLPHMGDAIATYDGLTMYMDIQAWYGPEDTVILAVYDGVSWQRTQETVVSIPYPVSSLDWCLKNLSAPIPTPEVKAEGNGVSLTLGAERPLSHWFGSQTEGELLRNDGSGWKRVENTPWSKSVKVLPFNGKIFLAVDADVTGQAVYASADGLTWREIAALHGQGDWEGEEEYIYLNCAVVWTGKDYIAARKGGVRGHGPMGGHGGVWFGNNTSVYLLDEYLDLISSYDFGRLVEKVGYLDGVYYAQVQDSEGQADYKIAWDSPSSLYRSTDGKNWEKTDATPELQAALTPVQ